MVVVQPATQIVEWMSAWVTFGFAAPGVRARFGSTAPAATTTSPPVVIAGLAGADVAAACPPSAAVAGVQCRPSHHRCVPVSSGYQPGGIEDVMQAPDVAAAPLLCTRPTPRAQFGNHHVGGSVTRRQA